MPRPSPIDPPSARPAAARWTAALFMVALTCAVLLGCRATPPGSDGPSAEDLEPVPGHNLVLVLSDALRAANLSVYGYPRPTSPRLERLAAGGVAFENHLANFPGTPVSVSQLLSARRAPPLLMSSGLSFIPYHGLPGDLLVLPRELRAAGYHTVLVSSHPWFDAQAPVLEFFDQTIVVDSEDGHPYASMERLVEHAERILAERAGEARPFFLYVHAMDTHMPYRRRPAYDVAGDRLGPLPSLPPEVARSERSAWLVDGYDRQIVRVDHLTGQLWDRLEELGLAERTVFTFLSDHGDDLHEMGDAWWHEGHGDILHRAQVHIPWIVRAPGLAPRRVARLSRQIDVAPTLLGLLGSTVDVAPFRLDGADLLAADGPAADGQEEPVAVAWSHRHWSMFWRDGELVFDQWQDRFDQFTIEPDALHYPWPVQAPAPDPDVVARLAAARDGWRREMAALPVARRPAGPIGIPTRVTADSPSIPTYEAGVDDRWQLKVSYLLRAEPGETPPPLSVETSWPAGRYRLWAHLARDSGSGLLRLRINRGDELVVRAADANPHGLVPLGSHDLGPDLHVRFAEPDGGIALVGFVVTPEGDAEVDLPSEEEQERLRALGYLE